MIEHLYVVPPFPDLVFHFLRFLFHPSLLSVHCWNSRAYLFFPANMHMHTNALAMLTCISLKDCVHFPLGSLEWNET